MIVQCLLIQFSAEHKPHHLCVPSCVLIMLFQRHDWSWKNLSGRQPEERDPKKVRSRTGRDRQGPTSEQNLGTRPTVLRQEERAEFGGVVMQMVWAAVASAGDANGVGCCR